jgi:hypothetical protein
MTWRRVAFVLLLALVLAPAARSGHELPVYPSYYPHEIEIARLTPERAAALLLDGKIQAYVGSAPSFSGAPPDTIQSIESLGALVTVRVNPASMHAHEEASACAAVRAVARDLTANHTGVIIHPYPVTPLHGDYLDHLDLAEDVKASLLDAKQAAPAMSELKVKATGAAKRLLRGETMPDAWDVEIAEVDAMGLIAPATTAMNGWLGPQPLKSGWYQAYLVLRDGVAPRARERVEAMAQRLLSGDFAVAVERINLERDFVAQLIGGCGNVVIGYTVKREYFNAEFSAGIENVGFDSLTGLNSAIFLRTVKLKDFPWNGWLALGIDARPAAAWNPVAGFTDPFGRLMWSALGDPALLPAPYGSAWMINRVSDVQVVLAR